MGILIIFMKRVGRFTIKNSKYLNMDGKGKDSDQSSNSSESNYSLRSQKRKREESESEESVEESTKDFENQEQESNLNQKNLEESDSETKELIEETTEELIEETTKELIEETTVELIEETSLGISESEESNPKKENSGWFGWFVGSGYESDDEKSNKDSNKEVKNHEESNLKLEKSSGESKLEPISEKATAKLIDESEIGQDADLNQENSSEGSDSNNNDSDSEEPCLMAKFQRAIQTMQGWSLNNFGIFGCILGIVIGFGIFFLAVIMNIESFPCPSETIDNIMHSILDKIIELQLRLI